MMYSCWTFLRNFFLKSGIIAIVFLFQNLALSQHHIIPKHDKKTISPNQTTQSSSASNWFDVSYYKLEIIISTQPNYLNGKVTINGRCLENNSLSLTLDLAQTMRLDSISVNGEGCIFVQRNSSFEITLDRPYQKGEALSITVFYQGLPVASGFGSFVFNNHNGVPWIYTLSEPFGASDWWPCKNNPSDKADSADIIVTCDSMYKVGSQGKLISIINHGNGKTTHHWKEQYPIAAYLISIAVTNYVQFSNWFRYSASDSMEVLNYVLPEHYADAVQSLPKTIEMLSIFSNLFGLYPFIHEKYGHSEFAIGGMEHQTMTSISTFDEDIVAHELAHQWFGDMITCRTWSDLWLNEGFAQYSTALYREKRYGSTSYWEYMNPILQNGTFARGIIGLPDTTNPAVLFNFSLMYAKGASILHMLRHILGDTLFFQSIYSYANDPKLKYSTATTDDFKKVCENIANKDLDYFFQEWIYGENTPSYQYSWNWNSSDDSSKLVINLQQPTGRLNPVFFTMPLDFRIATVDKDTTVTVFNNALEQTFSIHLTSKPISVKLDPEGWVLKKVISGTDPFPSNYNLEQNFPNPFNSTTTIRYTLPTREHVTLTIYDVLGREIERIVDARQLPGSYEYHWSPQFIASGVYFYRLEADGIQLQKKMIVIR